MVGTVDLVVEYVFTRHNEQVDQRRPIELLLVVAAQEELVRNNLHVSLLGLETYLHG